jgi:tetratricopeptide (TPR) repeat protein
VASDHIEVRNRDYFFTPGFIFFGMSIGLGLAIAARFVLDGLSSRKGVQAAAKYVLPIIFLLPLVTLARNYHECDRSENYMAYDYAWNLLQSADPHSVLFTNGDNDTFPLWCLQEVHKVRTDVTVVNLSLANTKWYIKQIQSIMGLDLGWTEGHIDSLRAYRLPERETLESRGQRLSPRIYGYLAEPEPVLDSLFRAGPVPYGEVFQYRDMVIDKLIYNHLDSIPIAFSVTTGGGVRRYLGRSLSDRIILSAMDWRVTEGPAPAKVDIEESLRFFGPEGEFQARGVADPNIYKSETALRLTNNWANGFLVVAAALRDQGDLERAEYLAARASRLIPHSDDAVDFVGSLYADQGKVESLDSLAQHARAGDPLGIQTHLAIALRHRGEDERAETILNAVLDQDPEYRVAFETLLQLYYESRQYDKLQEHLREWLLHNPDDRRAKAMLRELKRGNTP